MQRWMLIGLLICLFALTACGSSAVQTTLLVTDSFTEDGVAYVAAETGPGQAELFQLAAPTALDSGATYCVTTTPPVGESVRVIMTATPCNAPALAEQPAQP